MSIEVNFDYYSEDDILNSHIDNVIMMKKYLDTLLKEIKSGEYNLEQIKKISLVAEEFFNEIDCTKSEYKFNPKSSIIELNSDTSESDSDLESVVYLDDEKTREQKLLTYQNKMEKYMSPSKSQDKFRTYNSDYSGLYNEPEFLDDDEKQVNSNYILHSKIPNKDGNSLMVPHNTPYHHELQINLYNQHLNKSHSTNGSSLFPEQKTTISSPLTYEKVPDEEYDRLEKMFQTGFTGMNKQGTISETPISENKTSSDIPKPKSKDKLVDEFLNNNLELDNYHYLKSFNNQRVDSYIEQCYTYYIFFTERIEVKM
jgi:hypothetical protein